MPELKFNEEKHQYFLDGCPIPSVSEIIKPLHDKIYKNINEYTLEIAADILKHTKNLEKIILHGNFYILNLELTINHFFTE